ncbi:MAG: hypothetical protein RMK99_03095 [Anaerolineales bacterium]|nr:hypothetical protein [Anaerolineales bacterium]
MMGIVSALAGHAIGALCGAPAFERQAGQDFGQPGRALDGGERLFVEADFDRPQETQHEHGRRLLNLRWNYMGHAWVGALDND